MISAKAFIFFVAIISSGDNDIVQVKADTCKEAVEIVAQSLSTGYYVLDECLGSTDLELELLEKYTGEI